jgi:hypothetical protein
LTVWSLRHLPDQTRAAATLLALDAIWRDTDTPTSAAGALVRRLVVVDEACCAMRRSAISLAQRGEMGGISLDLMADPEPKGDKGKIACQETSDHAQAYGVMR